MCGEYSADNAKPGFKEIVGCFPLNKNEYNIVLTMKTIPPQLSYQESSESGSLNVSESSQLLCIIERRTKNFA